MPSSSPARILDRMLRGELRSRITWKVSGSRVGAGEGELCVAEVRLMTVARSAFRTFQFLMAPHTSDVFEFKAYLARPNELKEILRE